MQQYLGAGHFDCRTGESAAVPPPTGGCTSFPGPEWPSLGGPDWQEPSHCSASPESAVYVMEDCDASSMPAKLPAAATPEACVPEDGAGAAPRAGRADASPLAEIGDPVDLTRGTVKQTVLDLEAGGGLRFVRHYASGLEPAAYGATTTGPMGYRWVHGLEWGLEHRTTSTNEFYLVRRPLGSPLPFFRMLGDDSFPAGFQTSRVRGGALAVAPGGEATFTAEDGTRAVFGAAGVLVTVTPPGELPIAVSHGTDSDTFTRGGASLTVTRYGAGAAWPGRVKSVAGGGETVTYGYTAVSSGGTTYTLLSSVTMPDRTTLAPSDTITLVYTYASPTTTAPGLLTKVERTAQGTTAVLGEWGYAYDPAGRAHRAVFADEPALDQPLGLAWTTNAQTGAVQAEVRDGQSHLLATFGSEQGRLVAVTGAGGPGVPVPFSTGELESMASSPMNRWHTQTDANGHTTLFEAYARDGAPGRIVEGWQDNDANGVFSSGDGSARFRELTWHGRLARPLTVTEPSALGGAFEHVVTYDYDDPATPGNTDAANEAPTDRVHRRIETGMTLDAGGAVVQGERRIVSYYYDPAGRLALIAGLGRMTVISYDGDGTGGTTGFRNLVKRCLDASCSTFLQTTYADFDARGNPQTVTDPNGRVTTFTHDGLGRVVSATAPWSGTGSSKTCFTYDLDGNLVRVDFATTDCPQQPSALSVRMGYDAKRNLLFIADGEGNALVWEYDRGRPSRAARYTGFIDYGSRGTLAGDAKASYDPVTGWLSKAFNPLFADDSVFTEVEQYDGAGNPTQVKDENGRSDVFVLDAIDRLEELQQLRDGGGRPVTYRTGVGYDVQSNVAEITDPAAKATTYRTDDFGSLVEVISPDTGTTRYLYDAAGRLATKIEIGRGGSPTRTTAYVHDGLGRVTHVDLPSDPDWDLTYDTDPAKNQKGRLARVSNGIVTTAYEYTDRGQVAVERTTIDGLVFETVWTYDAAGRVETLRSPGGVTTTMVYRGFRPQSVFVAAGQTEQAILGLAWQPFGPRTRAELPPYDSASPPGNRVVSTRDYNPRGQVSEIDVTGPGGLTVLDRSYTYDYTAGAPGPEDPGPGLDRVIDHRDGAESRFYVHDELDRLWKATTLSGAPVFTYAYDAAGNRTGKSTAAGATAYAYEPGSDRLLAATGTEPMVYAHDGFGSRTWAAAWAPAQGQATHLYDDESRLATVQTALSPPNVVAQYAHDGMGRRVKKATASTTTYFFYDRDGTLLAEVKPRSSDTDIVRRYVFVNGELMGLVDRWDAEAGAPAWAPGLWFEIPAELRPPPGIVPVAVLLVAATLLVPALRRRPLAAAGLAITTTLSLGSLCDPPTSFSWVHTDVLGTPLAVTATTAASPTNPVVIWRASYEPFGKATVDQDPDGDGMAFTLNVRLPGQYHDGETGLHDNYFRTYDPATGRYLEADPIGLRGGLNLYTYVLGNPLSRADPLGLYGTNDCSYYDRRCQESGGYYYCQQAPYYCNNFFPKPPDPNPLRDDDFEGWFRCTRQCLQDCDAAENTGQSKCPVEVDDRSLVEGKSFGCHATCYIECRLPGGLTGNPWE